jgi:hypothetical protein
VGGLAPLPHVEPVKAWASTPNGVPIQARQPHYQEAESAQLIFDSPLFLQRKAKFLVDKGIALNLFTRFMHVKTIL